MGRVRKTSQRRNRFRKDLPKLVEMGLVNEEEVRTFCVCVSGRIGGSKTYKVLMDLELYSRVFFKHSELPVGFEVMRERIREEKHRLFKIEEAVFLNCPGIYVTRIV